MRPKPGIRFDLPSGSAFELPHFTVSSATI
jgi:hypothetical protein